LARYEHVTRFIDAVEAVKNPTPKAEMEGLHKELVEAFYEPFVLGGDYMSTLKSNGMMDARHRHVNVESLSLDIAIAILVLLHRLERGMYAPGGKTPLMLAFEDGYAVRLLKRIAELDGTWERPNVVTFYHEYEKDGYLSNWYETAPFTYDGRTFPTSEHWMMWHKAQLFWDRGSAERILAATSLDEVKQLGKRVKPYDDAAWAEVRVPVMRVGLRQKFAQNERLLNDLLSTGSAVLAEAAPNDRTWGLGIGKGDPRLDDPLEWHGRNLLGITLMEVRSDLRALASNDGDMRWDDVDLSGSHIWNMSLLELARIPSTRPAALMYAQMIKQAAPNNFQGTKDVLRKVDGSLADIDESMRLNMGCGLPIVGWHILLDELALQVRLGRL